MGFELEPPCERDVKRSDTVRPAGEILARNEVKGKGPAGGERGIRTPDRAFDPITV